MRNIANPLWRDRNDGGGAGSDGDG